MKIELSKEVLESLPAPDSKGLVRVSVGIKVSEEGKSSLVEINDVPVKGDDEETEEPEKDPAAEALKETTESMPTPEDMEAGLYA